MLRKITDCKSLKFSQKKLYDGALKNFSSQFCYKENPPQIVFGIRPSCRSAESSSIFTGKPLGWRPFFARGLEFIYLCNFIEKGSNAECFLHGTCTAAFFKLSKHFQGHFLTKWHVSNL